MEQQNEQKRIMGYTYRLQLHPVAVNRLGFRILALLCFPTSLSVRSCRWTLGTACDRRLLWWLLLRNLLRFFFSPPLPRHDFRVRDVHASDCEKESVSSQMKTHAAYRRKLQTQCAGSLNPKPCPPTWIVAKGHLTYVYFLLFSIGSFSSLGML